MSQNENPLDAQNVDSAYVSGMIAKIERAAKDHQEKFAGEAVHKDCLKRFEQVAQRLREELVKLSSQGRKPGASTPHKGV